MHAVIPVNVLLSSNRNEEISHKQKSKPETIRKPCVRATQTRDTNAESGDEDDVRQVASDSASEIEKDQAPKVEAGMLHEVEKENSSEVEKDISSEVEKDKLHEAGKDKSPEVSGLDPENTKDADDPGNTKDADDDEYDADDDDAFEDDDAEETRDGGKEAAEELKIFINYLRGGPLRALARHTHSPAHRLPSEAANPSHPLAFKSLTH